VEWIEDVAPGKDPGAGAGRARAARQAERWGTAERNYLSSRRHTTVDGGHSGEVERIAAEAVTTEVE